MGQWRQPKTGSQRFPRVSAHVPVRVSTVDPESDPDTGKLFYRSVEETTANLSRGGAFVHSWEPLAAGRRVVVEIDLPEHPDRCTAQNLQLVGRVAWTRRRLQPSRTVLDEAPGYGIAFLGGSKAELARLDRYLEAIEPERPKAPRSEPNPSPTQASNP